MKDNLDPETAVQWQLDAYNARNIDALLEICAEDAQLFEHPSKLLACGAAQLRERYTARFAEANLHATLVHRIVMGGMVIDHEKIARTFPEGLGTLEMIAMYQVIAGKIAKAWFISGVKTLDAT
jgi:hypothetical protein